MPGLRAKRMKGLRIDETSGVDAPAHLAPGWMVMKSEVVPGADLTVEDIEALIKAEENQGEPVKELIESLTKALGTMPDAAKAQATALIGALGGDTAAGADPVAKAVADALAKANTDREAAEARAKTAEAALAKARDGVLGTGAKETDEEALAEALETMPEPVRKAFQDGQARIAKAESAAADAVKKAETERDARVSAEYLTKAKGPDFAALPAAPETMATVLREIDEKLSKEAGAEAMRILKAASNLHAGGAGDFSEWGGAGADVSSGLGAQSAIEKAADDILKAEPTLSRDQAIVKAGDAHPDLVQAAQPQGGRD